MIKKIIITAEEMKAFKEWLGEDGIRYFRLLLDDKNTLTSVFEMIIEKKSILYFQDRIYEWKHIRNWFLEHTDLGKINNDIDLDEACKKILEEAIK